METILSHVVVGPNEAAHTAYVIHGILGSKSNWRTLARRFAERLPGWCFVVLDLRLHGESQGFAPPHTLAAVASDLGRLSRALDRRPDAVIGHSFGAKSTIAWMAAGTEPIARAVILDTNPGARPEGRGSETTLAVLAALARAGDTFARREDFIARLQAAGVSSMIAQWLAMNLVRDGEDYRLRLDLPAIEALLDDYFARDLWPVLESPALTTQVEVILGGRSTVLPPEDRARLEALVSRPGSRVTRTVIDEAGHWVHVDRPAAVTEAIVEALARPLTSPRRDASG